MSTLRNPKDYDLKVDRLRQELDRALLQRRVRDMIEALTSSPSRVDSEGDWVAVRARGSHETFTLSGLPDGLTTRMHMAIADILTDYLRELEAP